MKEKIKAIESIDADVVGVILEKAPRRYAVSYGHRPRDADIDENPLCHSCAFCYI